MLRGSGLDFLRANDLLVLEPLLYQFFVLQGMGLLETMPAYYVLKWASPASLSAGGFGDRSDEPLAMLRDGYGALVDALAESVPVDIRLGWRVSRVVRSKAEASATLHFDSPSGPSPSRPAQTCDMVALTGPIPEFVAGSLDSTRQPILAPASASETELFGPMRPMQFLISLLELTRTPDFKTLEYWPQNFEVPSAVIVRRDVGFAESGAAHAIGGLQSYSYWPVPTANRSTHWAAQRAWAAQHSLGFKQVLAQNYIDTYLFHHDVEAIVGPARKPWRLRKQQLADGLCNCTLYIGGSASFEAVEDVLHHNLQLVSELFDRDQPLRRTPTPRARVASAAPPARPPPRAYVLEQLRSTINCSDTDRFLSADAAVWTSFLRWTPGYVRKSADVVANRARDGLCEVWDRVEWYSRELWQAIPAAALNETQRRFNAALGGRAPVPSAVPVHGEGLTILTRVPRLDAFAAGQVSEVLSFDGVECGQGVARFVAANNATYTRFLRRQPGFIARETLTDDHAPNAGGHERGRNCTMWSRTRWQDMAAYEAVCAPGAGAAACAHVHADFVAQLGFDPPMQRWPMPTVAREDEAPFGPRLAVLAGIDVVAYHSLNRGAHDVRGSPKHRRWLNSSAVLPPELRRFHPRPYEFWFASEEHAAAFERQPLRYLPAFGGHCTHGIASRGDLNRTLLADGRMAFTCVNGTRWEVINGTLYMNSCGMWEDFIKHPEADVAKAHTLWREWFGEWIGPINDACVQDEGAWGGNPIGGLLPTECVLA